MRHRAVVGAAVIGGAAASYNFFVKPQHLRWGAADDEFDGLLPGDALIERADLTATRAITICARADAVWPWIAQLGQGRGGFYSYDFLENLVGCRIHSAHRIVAEWQEVNVGDQVKLAPEVSLTIAVLEWGQSLVLRGAIPIGNGPPPYDFTWAFVLQDQPNRTTRLIVRERYTYTKPWAQLIVEPSAGVSFVMSRKMLRGIKNRAEHLGSPVMEDHIANRCGEDSDVPGNSPPRLPAMPRLRTPRDTRPSPKLPNDSSESRTTPPRMARRSARDVDKLDPPAGDPPNEAQRRLLDC